MSTEEKDQLDALIRKSVDALGEHFDSVRIFCTKTEGESTLGINKGSGNHYATLGQITEWLDADKARTTWSEKPEE